MNILIFIFLLISNIEVMCQITESETSSIILNVGANGTYISGNVERLLIIPNIDFVVQNDNTSFLSSNRYQYGSIGKTITESDLLSKNFIYLFPQNPIYSYLMGWIETNKRKKYNFRYQIGPGLTFKILNYHEHRLKLSLTFTYEQTIFSNLIPLEYGINNYPENQRLTFRLAGNNELIKKLIFINYELWFQESIVYQNDNRIYLNANLELQLIKNLKFRTSLLLNYESIVVPNIKNTDLIITFGFDYLIKY